MIGNHRPRRGGAPEMPAPRSRGSSGRKAAGAVFGAPGRRPLGARSLASLFAVPAMAVALTIDRGLAAAGIAAAIGSAAFAAFMIGHDSHTTAFGRGEYRRVFTRAPGALPSYAHLRPTNHFSRPIDYNVTGSISGRDVGNGTPDPAARGKAASQISRGRARSESYVLSFVHKGMALVKSAHGFYVVRLGTKLPDAGQVLSIEKRGDKWILVTAKTIITEANGNF